MFNDNRVTAKGAASHSMCLGRMLRLKSGRHDKQNSDSSAPNGLQFEEDVCTQPEMFALQGVYVPSMYTELTTKKVLIMEWIDGTRLKSSSQGGQGAREELKMVEIGVRCSLEQMLEEGYYHSDPHPGNLFKMGGKLAYLDFGMMGEIEAPIRRSDHCVTVVLTVLTRASS